MDTQQNNQDQLPEEEIPNLEQFQVGRAPSSDDDQLEEDMDDLSGSTEEVDDTDDMDDVEYTDDEIEYADGEGTLLDDEIGDDDDDEEI